MTNDEPQITIIKGPRGPFTVDHEQYEIEGDPNGRGGTIRMREPQTPEQDAAPVRRLKPFRQVAEQQQ
jgi:hypothetical protein